MRCQASQPQCVQENGICGGPGQLTQSCCGEMQCTTLLGGNQMRCAASAKNELAASMGVPALRKESEHESQCTEENDICGGSGQLTQSCCGDMQCTQHLGGSQMRCQASLPQCVQENGVCGGPGQLIQSCCGDMQCATLLGGSQIRCQAAQPECVQENGICGGPGQLTQSCCGEMQCTKLLGGSQMRCAAIAHSAPAVSVSATALDNTSGRAFRVDADRIEENSTGVRENVSFEASAEVMASSQGCAAKSEQCHSWRPCCRDMQCENLLGGSGKVCVQKQPQCLQEDGICGGSGQLTQSCCGDMQCKRLLGGSQMRCQKSQPQCVQENGICGGRGLLTQSCCGSMQCKLQLGGSKMRCSR